MQKSVKHNFAINVSNQILSLVTPFITTPYVSRILQADGIGRFSYADSIVAYFVLFASMGIGLYGQREISYCQDDREKRSKVFWEIKLLSFVFSLFSLVLYLFFAANQTDRSLYLILSIEVVSCVIDVEWLYNGVEDFSTATICNCILKVLGIVFLFLFVKDKSDFYLYVMERIGVPFLVGLFLFLRLPKYVDLPKTLEMKPIRHLLGILSLFVPKIAIYIYNYLDKTMIGLITKDAVQNGCYEQAIAIPRMMLTLVSALGYVVMSRVGGYVAEKNEEKIKATVYSSCRFVWFLVVPLSLGVSAISESFVSWFFGFGYELVVPLLRILSLIIIFIGISNVTGIQYLITIGKQKYYTISVFAGCCLNVTLNALLIPIYGAIGAAIASLAAEMMVDFVQLFFVRKELSISRILGSGVRYFLGGLLMYVVVSFIGSFLEPKLLNTLILVFTGALVYFLFLAIIKDDMLKAFFSKEKDIV